MKKLCLFGLVLVSFSLAAQSPWPRSKAGFFIQAAWQHIPTYTSVFQAESNPNFPIERELTENAAQLYGEYGLNSRTTLMAALPLRVLQSGDFIPGTNTAPRNMRGWLLGLGNISLGVKTAIFEGNLRLSGTFRVDLPSTIQDDRTGLRAGYDAWTFQPGLSTGISLDRWYWFAYGGGGLRTNGYSHFVNGGGEIGFKVWKIWIAGFSELLYSLENGSVATPLEFRATGLYRDRQGWWSLGAKTIFEANRFWGFTAAFAGASWAQFVPKSPAISLGVYYKWE